MAFPDARLPLVFGCAADATAADALLLEGEGDAAPGREWFQAVAGTAHPAGCTCCTPRNGAGMALSRLLLARGRGSGLFFRRVIAVASTPAGHDAVLRALSDDPIASGSFREG